MADSTSPSQVLLLSQPRTACHLLERVLSKQPNVKYLNHPLVAARPAQVAMLSDESVANDIPQKLRDAHADLVNEAMKTWEAALKEANDKGKTLFVHDHPHFALSPHRALEFLSARTSDDLARTAGSGNFTLVRDDLLLRPGTVPILTFRHPALVVPAIYRAMLKTEKSVTKSTVPVSCYAWLRHLYEFFVSNGITPVPVEAEDYMSSEEFSRHLATKAGLNPENCIFKWEKWAKEQQQQMPQVVRELLQTLINSDGLLPEKVVRRVSIEEEAPKWKQEFGDGVGTWLEEIALRSMTNYEFLLSKKLRL
ncbi:hypothetical protein ANO11243_093780 [Dothideomycetidae sp. 11243]|nr:hypothetical protein ANO11243_093780 [fungal sp. No.11243]